MTIPALRKWRPVCGFHHVKGLGWDFTVHPHRDYNPIFVVARWYGYWLIEAGWWRWSNDPKIHTPTKEQRKALRRALRE